MSHKHTARKAESTEHCSEPGERTANRPESYEFIVNPLALPSSGNPEFRFHPPQCGLQRKQRSDGPIMRNQFASVGEFFPMLFRSFSRIALNSQRGILLGSPEHIVIRHKESILAL